MHSDFICFRTRCEKLFASPHLCVSIFLRDLCASVVIFIFLFGSGYAGLGALEQLLSGFIRFFGLQPRKQKINNTTVIVRAILIESLNRYVKKQLVVEDDTPIEAYLFTQSPSACR